VAPAATTLTVPLDKATPESSAAPRSVMTRLCVGPLVRAVTVTVTSPDAWSVARAARPRKLPLAGAAAVVAGAAPAAGAAEPASNVTGVPARWAQPGCRGPTATNAAVATGSAAQASAAVSHPGRRWARNSRQPNAPVTAATQTASSASSQGSLLSVPVPSPCHSATGQHA